MSRSAILGNPLLSFYLVQHTCDEYYEYIQYIVRALVKVGTVCRHSISKRESVDCQSTSPSSPSPYENGQSM